MHQRRAGPNLEQLTGEMQRRADAVRSHIEFARLGLRGRDQFGHGVCGESRSRDERVGNAREDGDGNEIAARIVARGLVQRCRDGDECAANQQCVPIGG